MRIIEVTWSMAFRVWWSFFWRAMLFGMLAAFGVGAIIGVLGAITGADRMAVATLSGFLSLIIGFVFTFWAMKKVLYKRFSEFSVVCIANEPEPLQQPVATTASDDDPVI